MEIEENMEKAKEKAKQDAIAHAEKAKRDAEEAKKRAAEEKRLKAMRKEEPKKPAKQPTVDFSEIYSGIDPVE